jgi:hypothetical protein
MMHSIEIREQSDNLAQEIEWLLGAQRALMHAATGLNPPANLAQAKAMILEALKTAPAFLAYRSLTHSSILLTEN